VKLQKQLFLAAISLAFLTSSVVDCEAQLPSDTRTAQTTEPNTHNNSVIFWQSVICSAFSVLGSGLIVGVIGFLYNAKLDRKRRRAELLDAQLRELYGPLQFFASCSQNIYEHAWKIEEAYEQEFAAENASKHSGRTEEIDATLNVNNEYFELINVNKQRMVEILTNHYALIEPDDAEAFAGLLIGSVRRDTEFNRLGGLKLPREIYKRLGDISCLPPEFVKVVERRYKEKKAELERLSR
jgi:hypothetical protein